LVHGCHRYRGCHSRFKIQDSRFLGSRLSSLSWLSFKIQDSRFKISLCLRAFVFKNFIVLQLIVIFKFSNSIFCYRLSVSVLADPVSSSIILSICFFNKGISSQPVSIPLTKLHQNNRAQRYRASRLFLSSESDSTFPSFPLVYA